MSSTAMNGAKSPADNTAVQQSGPSPYAPPNTFLFSHLPAWAIPYAELMRLHKPAGYWTFYFPHLYGTLFGAIMAGPEKVPISRLIYVNIVFLLGNVLLRGAACSWNDAVDAPLDRQVARCRNRPCARGAVSVQQAYVFTFVQCAIGLVVLTALPPLCMVYWVPLTLMCCGYAFAKRLTDYPQVVLGFSLAVGQWVGAAAVGYDVAKVQHHHLPAVICFYLANVICAVVVDAVYSHQDLKDDLKAGVKSIAVAWQEKTKPLLWILTTFQIALVAAAGYLLELGTGYHLLATAGTALISWSMVYKVDLGRPESCWWWFVNSIYGTGACLSGGIFSSYLLQL